MLFVWIFLILGAVFIVGLVDFVLRNPMFAETFVIKIGIPFTHIEYTQEHVEFIYIIAGSLLLGALVIAVSTWVLDAKRKLKVRSLRKELKSLQKSVEEAKASLPQQEEGTEDGDASTTSADIEEQTDSSGTSISPEDITKSFEDTVEGGDFLDAPPEEESAKEDVLGTQTATDAEIDAGEEEKFLPEVTAVEAEVVASDIQADEDASVAEESAEDEKKESDRK